MIFPPKPEPSDSTLTEPDEFSVLSLLEEPAKELGTTPEELFFVMFLAKLESESNEATSPSGPT